MRKGMQSATHVAAWGCLLAAARHRRPAAQQTHARVNRRYGTVELTSVKEEAPAGWAWGHRLSLKGRRWLVWAHMAALNGISIGAWALAAGHACYKGRAWLGKAQGFGL